MLQKGAYPYEYIDNWKKKKKKKKEFYSNLNMEDIEGADYKHTERV